MELLKFSNTNIDMFFVQAGHQDCIPGYSNNLSPDHNYILHFITDGKGFFKIGGNVYRLKKGDAFFTPAQVPAYYCADIDNPWKYMWFEIYGKTAEDFFESMGLNAEFPIYQSTDANSIIKQFDNLFKAYNERNEYIYIAELFKLMGIMSETNNKSVSKKVTGVKEYTNLCMNYIKSNYKNKITVDALCEVANIERSYLFRIFRKHVGMSPQQYVIEYKLAMAAKLLEIGELNISEIAKNVGYDDQFAFSKLFKKQYGISPLEYKKNSILYRKKVLSSFYTESQKTKK